MCWLDSPLPSLLPPRWLNSTAPLCDDENAIVVQDILEDIKNKRLATEFFPSLLEDLTVVMIDDDLEI